MNVIDIDLTPALEEALRSVAPDGGSWLAGRDTFWGLLSRTTVGAALLGAFKAANPDENSWKTGLATFLAYTNDKNAPTSLQKAKGKIAAWMPSFRDNQFSSRQLAHKHTA